MDRVSSGSDCSTDCRAVKNRGGGPLGADAQDADHAGASDACGDLVPERRQRLRHDRCGGGLLERELGVLVQVPVQVGQRAGIDLQSLPYSYLVLDRRSVAVDGARVIGEPRRYKGYAKVLACDATGVRDTMIQKRDVPLKAIRSGSVLAPRPTS